MLHNTEEEARVKQIMEILDKSLQLGLKMDEVVGRLSEKRVTLEEKMIRAYFHGVSANLLSACALIHSAMASATTPKGDDAPLSSEIHRGEKIGTTEEIKLACASYAAFLERLEANLDMLLKALRYDLNYVEQYFEFNYYGKLTNEDKFLQDSQDLLDKLKTALQA